MKKIEINDFSADELEKMTIEELTVHMQSLYEAQQEIKSESRAAAAVLNKKQTDLNLVLKLGLDKLSGPELARLAELSSKTQSVGGSKIPREEVTRNGGEEQSE